MKVICRRYLMVAVLLLLAIVEIISLVAVIGTEKNEGSALSQPVLKISDIRGPRIDDRAVAIVVDEDSAVIGAAQCTSLPTSLWALLLIAYIVLLVFNFSYTFQSVSSRSGEQAARPQWCWEALYALFFLIGWYVWDTCHTAVWFPLATVKLGLIIFVLYLYFLERKYREQSLK